jgi:hypothetical protein
MEPLLALGVALVWGVYGGIYFVRMSKRTGRTTLVPSRLIDNLITDRRVG